MKLRIVFEDDEDGWVTYCPDLLGCVSQGKGVAEAKVNIKEAIELYLEVVLEDAVAENRLKYGDAINDHSKTLLNGHVEGHYRLEATV